MRLGVFFDGFCSSAEMLDVARRAEEAGADSLWFAQHMGYRDATVWAAAGDRDKPPPRMATSAGPERMDRDFIGFFSGADRLKIRRAFDQLLLTDASRKPNSGK